MIPGFPTQLKLPLTGGNHRELGFDEGCTRQDWIMRDLDFLHFTFFNIPVTKYVIFKSLFTGILSLSEDVSTRTFFKMVKVQK